MIRPLICIPTIVGLLAATAAHAQNRAPAQSWTGFYVGAQIGGGWGDRSVGYTPNDPGAALLTDGTLGAPGQQPFPANGFRNNGVTGGLTLGNNWQFAPRWIAGIEADFSASDIRGTGVARSVLEAGNGADELMSEQKIDWWALSAPDSAS